MESSVQPKKKKRRIIWYVLFFILFILTGAGIYLYSNFNQLLSDALMRSFDSNIVSDVYELKFENLKVNPIAGNIGVNNVVFHRREKPLKDYPYINSTLELRTERINLRHIDLYALLKEGKLILDGISIVKPDITLSLYGEKNVLFPYSDSNQGDKTKHKKKPINGFTLHEFELISAAFDGTNGGRERKFKISDFSIRLLNLFIDQKKGTDIMSFRHVALSFGEVNASMQSGGIQLATLKSFSLSIDSLGLRKSVDTLVYRFKDISTSLKGLYVQTADSINSISLGSFELSYKNKTIKLREAAYKPNISDLAIQRKFKFQQPHFSGSVRSVAINKINFDSLIYYRKIYIDEINIDSAIVRVYKDKLKPIDTSRFPEYFGQQFKKIPIATRIGTVNVSNVTLYNTERKPDSTLAKVSLNRARAQLLNITNLDTKKDFVMKASAFIDNKVHFSMKLDFSYEKPEFAFTGNFKKFDLMDLNPLIKAYTPARVSSGKVDEISFSGIAGHRSSDGTMKFLYHDLIVDLELKNQKKWKSSAIAFAANSFIPSNNPESPEKPPHIVNFHAERDMNKGFINIVLRSALTGLKESLTDITERKKNYQTKYLKAQEFFGKKKK